MTDVDREQLKRDCADALSAVQKDGSVNGLDVIEVAIAELGPSYRAHAVLLHAAVADRKDMAIMWNLLHVLEKLEKET
jgi:hypothetical protein